MITAFTTKEELLEIASSTVRGLQRNEEFSVSDLFRKIEWKRIPIRTRRALGALFYDCKDELDITPIGTGSPQRYIKN